jgi:hypothetical protein
VSDTNELDRLRAEIKAIDTVTDLCNGIRDFDPSGSLRNLRHAKIHQVAKLEAEADPWRLAKENVADWIKREHEWDRPMVAQYVRHLEADNAAKDAAIARLVTEAEKAEREVREMSQECQDRGKERDEALARIAELENQPEFNPGDYATAKEALWHWRNNGDELQKEIAEYVLFLLAGISQRNRREMESQKRIAELEARPVPPLDPKRVIATACLYVSPFDEAFRCWQRGYLSAGGGRANMTSDEFSALLLGSTGATIFLLAVYVIEDWMRRRARR